MAKTGIDRMPAEKQRLIGDRRVQREDKARQIVKRVEVERYAYSLDDLEEYCRTLIPEYDPWSTAIDGQYFDLETAEHAVRFFHDDLCHVKGAKSRTAFMLEPWQQAIVGNLFGWKDAKGLRRYREAFIEVARKNGKSPLAAGILLYGLFEDNEFGAEIYGAASSFQQATLVFEHARGMVAFSDRLADRAKIYQGQAKAIQLGENEGWSTYRVVSREADAAHGWNTHIGILDELHTLDSRDLVDALQTSTAAREQPLIVYITTSDFDRESICNEKEDYAIGVRTGQIVDPSFLPVVYQLEPDDDWTDIEVLRKANPNLGVSVSMEYILREIKRAEETPTYENTFKRLHGNIRTQQDVRWISLTDWDATDHGIVPADLEGRECFAGLDLASTADTTSLVLLFRIDGRTVLLPYFWVPKANIRKRERTDKVPYETWVQEGYMDATKGNVTDYDQIRADIGEIGKRYQIREIAIDRWNSTQLQTQLMRDGFTITQFGQGFASMAAPTKELERLVVDGKIDHGENPVLRWMAGNVAVEEDAAGNMKPSKAISPEKIDGIVAAIMALGRAMVAPEKKKRAYTDRGARFL